MSLKIQLERAQSEINSGLKQRASNRLQNVINTYLDAVEARELLAQMYYDSGFLDMAGRFWMLTPPTDDKIKVSIEIYKKSVNYSPLQILIDIKYRGHKTGLTDYARATLLDLEAQAAKKGYGNPYKPREYKEKSITKNPNWIKEKFEKYFLLSIVFLCISFFLVGFVVCLMWLVSLF